MPDLTRYSPSDESISVLSKNEHDTLLSDNVANIVTAVSLATRLSLRCSSLFFDAVFDVAKYGASFSLGLSRNAITNAISTAKNLHPQSTDQTSMLTIQQHSNNLFLKVLEKYTNIGLSVVNHTFSLAELFTISGLQFTARTIKSGLKAAEESVRIVDGIFGSNETSRAIASIITLVHRELMNDPDFSLAKAGRLAILAGLTKALTVFAILQNVTHKRTILQIPSTTLWQGLVEHDSEDSPPLAESKKRQTTNKKSHELVAQDLKTTLGHTNSNNMYKIATTSTCITTRTTFISPIDQSTLCKKITTRTSQEETQAFLAVVNQKPKKIILTKVPGKHERRRVEQRQESIEQPQMTVEKNSQARRYSSSQQLDYSSKLFEKGKDKSHCRDTFPTALFMRPSKSQTYKRRPSIEYHRPQRSNSIACNPTFQMTAYTPSPIPSPSLSTTSQKEDISYYEHGWNFPRNHIINNIAHFMRYASAAYGESFMRILGIGNIPNVLPNSHHHHPNHHAFAHHTGNSVEDILLSSYTGRSPLHLHNPSMHALVHYVTVDHAAKAIVLTCRGTLGLSDVLTDLNCEYSEFTLPSEDEDEKTAKRYKAHSGMLDAAQLLAKEKGKVYRKIRQGLENYPDYGLVMCGHSLGASVVSLLSVLWSERKVPEEEEKKEDYFSKQEFPMLLSDTMPSFVTSRLSGLPAGRPIHCYAYGPPGVMDLELSKYCAGLVTTVVHGNDVVATLSLGVLKDFKNIATSLHLEQEATEEIINRVVGRMRQKSKDQEEVDDDFNEDDQWFWAMIKTMRADMTSEKMYPPNTVYLIEAIPQTEQDKIVLSRCDNVESRFSELLFSRTMFIDHSPLMYERSIRKLCKGFFGDQEAYERV